MAACSEASFTNKTMKRVALLHYISDQLRCYADELEAQNEVLPAFADMLDELAHELQTTTESKNALCRPGRAVSR